MAYKREDVKDIFILIDLHYKTPLELKNGII